MKFTAKKTVSEVVIDLEDGCVLKLTRSNLNNLTFNNICVNEYVKECYQVLIDMKNGIDYRFKTTDKLLIESLELLCTY